MYLRIPTFGDYYQYAGINDKLNKFLYSRDLVTGSGDKALLHRNNNYDIMKILSSVLWRMHDLLDFVCYHNSIVLYLPLKINHQCIIIGNEN